MSLRFPSPDTITPVSSEEWAALRSLNHAYTEALEDYHMASALSGSLAARQDTAESYAEQSPPWRHHATAVSEVSTHTIHYEERVGAVAWRMGSASVALGMAVLDRLLDGRPALPIERIVHLADHEPALGELKKIICGLPLERLVDLREDDNGFQEDNRQSLMSGIKSAEQDVASSGVAVDVNAWHLSVAPDESSDPFWTWLLEPVLALAESLPYEISYWCKQQQVS